MTFRFAAKRNPPPDEDIGGRRIVGPAAFA
jgi:hypothetical protein